MRITLLLLILGAFQLPAAIKPEHLKNGAGRLLEEWRSPVPRHPRPRISIPDPPSPGSGAMNPPTPADQPPMPPIPRPGPMTERELMREEILASMPKPSPPPLPTRFGPRGEVVNSPAPSADERYPNMMIVYPKRISEYPPGNLHFHFDELEGTNACIIQRRFVFGEWHDFGSYQPSPAGMQVQGAFTNQVQFRVLAPIAPYRKGWK